MCRFLIFKGRHPILLANLLTRPAHSIINQSYDSRLRVDTRMPMNGDGFGVGYYSDDADPEMEDGPCVYCAITPAWNNLNLARLAEKTKSELVFAHVRASTSGVLSETNCHPFVYHNFMFMHNGNISHFDGIKRRLANHIDEKYFTFVQGSTDSEWSFALFLDCLDKMGVDPADCNSGAGHVNLRSALMATVGYLRDWVNEYCEGKQITPEPSLMNFAVTDGHSIAVTRYITSKTDAAASLHFSTGSKFVEDGPGQYKMVRQDRRQDTILVASEPLTFERNDWVTVPTNTCLVINDQTVLMYPIIDQYYQCNPGFLRSSELAEKLGLVSPAIKSPTPDPQTVDVAVPPLGREVRRRRLSIKNLDNNLGEPICT